AENHVPGHVVDSYPLESKEFLAGLSIPQLYSSCGACAGQASAVRTERHAAAAVLEDEKFLAGLRIPDFHCLLLEADGQTLAVRAERNAPGRVARERLERQQLLSGLHIPHLTYTTTETDQAFAVRAEGQEASASLEGEQFLPGLRIPYLHPQRGSTSARRGS